MKIDTSSRGILGFLAYAAIGTYEWINAQGFDAYVVTSLAVLMVLDMCLVWVKFSIHKDLPNPSSKEAKLGVLKKTLILLLPLLIGVAYRIVTHDISVSIKIINVALSALALAEIYSNIGHIYTIYTGEILSEFDAITFFIKKIGQIIKGLLEKVFITRDNENNL